MQYVSIRTSHFLCKFRVSCYRNPAIPRVCLATASPAKFEEAVTAASLEPQPTESIKALFSKPVRYADMEKSEDWTQTLRDKLEDIFYKVHS